MDINKYILSILVLLSLFLPKANAQKISVYFSPIVGRSFVYSSNFSSKGSASDYIHSYGNILYGCNLKIKKNIFNRITATISPVFIRTDVNYQLYEIEPYSLQIERGWLAKMYNYTIYTGLSYDITKESGIVKLNLGVVNGIVNQKISASNLVLSTQGRVTIDDRFYYSKEKFQTALEAGITLSMYTSIDLIVAYRYGITLTAPLNYQYSTIYNGNYANSNGVIKGRPNYVSAELSFRISKE